MKYWSHLQLSDGEKWVHLLSAGQVKHPLHGVVDLSKPRLQKFVDNFKKNVRGTDLDVDFDHKLDPAKGRKAAGWIKDLQVRNNGLYALIDWTDEAKEAIKNGEYKYISADFYDKWTDQDGQVYQNVLAGAGITNRPFLKDLLPINLNEIVESEDGMDPELKKLLVKQYQLSEDATDEQVHEAVKNASQGGGGGGGTNPDPSKAEIQWSQDGSEATVKIPGVEGEIKVKAPESPQKHTDEDDELKQLAESHPAVAQMLEERKQDQKRLEQVEHAQRYTELNHQLGEIEGLPPVVLTELRDTLVAAPKQFSDKIVDAVKKLKEQGFVPQKQFSAGQGPSTEDDLQGQGAVKKFTEAVDAAMKADNQLSEGDAYDKVATENPQLYDDYVSAVRDGHKTFGEIE